MSTEIPNWIKKVSRAAIIVGVAGGLATSTSPVDATSIPDNWPGVAATKDASGTINPVQPLQGCAMDADVNSKPGVFCAEKGAALPK